MFSSAIARNELNICLRCEYLLLYTSASRSATRHTHLQRFATSSRRIEAEKISNDAGAANISSTHGRSYESRAALLGDIVRPDRRNGEPQRDTLRLATPDDGLEQTFGQETNHRRRSVRYLVKPEYGDQSKTQQLHRISTGEDTIQDSSREDFKYPAYRHPDVTSDRVDLGVDRLGERATIRVLPERRDRGRRNREKLPTEEDEEKSKKRRKWIPPPTSFDEIAKALDLENEGAAGAVESMNNLETIRKAFQDSTNQFDGPTQVECLKLANILDSGFTAAQLSAYEKLAKAIKHTEEDKLDQLTIHDRYRVSRWFVGKCKWPEPSVNRLDPKFCNHEQDHYAVLSSDTLDENGYPKQNSKQKLINAILSRYWGIRPLEERSQKGSVHVQVGKDWLALLLSQKESVFYKVFKLFGVKTMVIEEHSLVRITGSYDACVDAVRTIVNSISAGRLEQIDLFLTASRKKPSVIQKAFLLSVVKQQQFWREVEAQTFTRIVPLDARKNGFHTKIDVYYLSTDTKSLVGVKTRVFHLQKLLNLYPSVWISHPQPSSTKPSLVPISDSPSMTVIERHLNWYRWSDRRPPETGYTDVPAIQKAGGTIFDKLAAFWSSQLIEKVQTVQWKDSPNKFWAHRPQTLMTATLGQLGHAMAPAKYEAMQLTMDRKEQKLEFKDSALKSVEYSESVFKHQRTILPSIPHLFSLLNAKMQDQSTLSNHFKINLSPETVFSTTTSVSVDQIPALELEIKIDEASKTTKLQSVRLLIHRKQVDFALPRQTSDVRFDAETFVLGSVNNFDPAVRKFVEMSKLNIWGTGHFETPPKLLLTIPKGIYQLMEEEVLPATSRVESSSSGSVPETVQSGSQEEADISTTITENARQAVDAEDSLASLPREIDLVSDTLSKQDTKDSADDKSMTDVDEDLQMDSANEVETKRSSDRQGSTAIPIKSSEDHGVDQTPNKDTQSLDIEEGDIQVEYVFDSLMICSKLQSLYQGFPLSLSTIEAGQVGGKREEVKFEIPGIADELMNVKDKDLHQERVKVIKSYFMAFFGSIFELVSRLPR